MAVVDPQQVTQVQRTPKIGGSDGSTVMTTLIWSTVVFLVGFLARFYGIGNMPFWLDEVTTVQRSSRPFWDLVNNSLAAHHLPSYFLITSAIGHLGFGETILRMPSAFFGAASCSMLFLIGRTLGGWRVGLVAGLLLALSPLQVQYGQEARSYTFVILMMAVGFWGLVQMAQDPKAASLPWISPQARVSPWLLYTIGTLASLQILSTAFFWLISANLAAIAIMLDRTVDRRRFMLRWLAAHAIILLFTLPWFYAMDVVTRGEMTNATNWVPPTNLHSFLSTIGSLYLMRVSRLVSFHLFPASVPAFGALLVEFAIMGVACLLPRHSQRGRPVALSGRPRTLLGVLVVAAIAPPLIIFVISFFKPLWMPRYLIWSAIPFFVFVGLGVNFLPLRWRSSAAAGVILLAGLNLAPYYQVETKPRWDLAGPDLRQVMMPGDIILVPDQGPVDMMNFFLARQGDAIPPALWTTDVFAAARHVQEGGRVWAVFGRVGQNDRTSDKNFAKVIEPLGAPVGEIQDGDLIWFRLYAPTPGG